MSAILYEIGFAFHHSITPGHVMQVSGESSGCEYDSYRLNKNRISHDSSVAQ